MITTVVIGGGITGLSAAHRLATTTDHQVIVCEAAPRLGGKLHRLFLDHDHGDFAVDVGAESMLARRPEGLELITALGLDDRRVQPTGARAQAFLDGQTKPLPPSNMGVPVDVDALQGYLSPEGVRRAASEPELPSEPLTGDVSIGGYVAERFGEEVTDRVLEPMLGGVYAGHSRRLSFEAVHPKLYAEARSGGSLLEAARRVSAAGRRDQQQTAAPVFAGLDGGVSTLITALRDDLEKRGVIIRTGSTVRKINKTTAGFEVITGPVPWPEALEADQVLITTPATPTARLVGDLVPQAAEQLEQIPYASMAVITFVLAGAALQGSGLLVPPGELPTIKAFTYSSNKWGWIAERAAEVFGDGTAVVRASVGRFGEEHLLQVDDQQLIERTLAEARQLPGWESALVRQAKVQRWGGGLPQYVVGHRDRVTMINSAVAELPGLAVAGAYLDGLGIPACIASGRLAVDRLLG